MNGLALAPLSAVVAGALASLLLEAFLKKRGRELPVLAAVLSLFAAGVLIVLSWGRGLASFGGRLSLDPLALLLMAVFVLVSAFVLLMSLEYGPRRGINLGQLCGLLLLAAAGLMIMVSSTDWLVVFLGLEVLSVASYALAGLRRNDRASSEAAAKYFLLGSFAGAFFVFGLALLYGTTGRLDFGAGLAAGAGPAVGLGLILTALFFKIAIAPFHMWAPDVYDGAPTPVTVFLTIAPKAAGLAVLIRVLSPLIAGGGAASVFGPAVSVAAVLTMFAGNLAALRQTRVKRLLAYSAIAHSGYLLVAVVAGDAPGLVFYLVAYLFMNAGAFGVLMAMSGKSVGAISIADLAGLGRRHPWLAASLALFLLSLAGVPPTAGFLAKFYIFSAAVAKGHVLLAVAAVMASLVSVAYYLKVVMAMYMQEGGSEPSFGRNDPALYLVLFLCLFGVLELGLWPGNLLTLIRQGLTGLF
ncbi:MAG: NADH-quinone oxidoreductase subunit N [Candidatus Aminicenantes bacterium]|nr:NADH-quinone oxidoreductase subunit N [Candidatus Aminicenantes bacterium]